MTGGGNKSSLVGVRFSPEEKTRLQEMATRQNRTLSELIRSLSLGHLERERKKIVPELNRKFYFELGEISGRLQDIEPDSPALVDLENLLRRVQREILGLEPIAEREER